MEANANAEAEAEAEAEDKAKAEADTNIRPQVHPLEKTRKDVKLPLV